MSLKARIRNAWLYSNVRSVLVRKFRPHYCSQFCGSKHCLPPM